MVLIEELSPLGVANVIQRGNGADQVGHQRWSSLIWLFLRSAVAWRAACVPSGQLCA
jgi:hypothetical protein